MKANELMIGDWFEWHPDAIPTQKHYEKVTIKTLQVLLTSKKHRDCCNPIPLTAEILEKNGWDGIDNYRKYGAAYGVFNDDYKCEIGCLEKFGRCFLTINGWEYSICEIKGVHELQHALRLCGLNELADNFKV